MPRLSRILLALLAFTFLFSAASLLLHRGTYGWTLFVLIPIFLGSASTLLFRPTTAAQAAGTGALTILGALTLLLVVAVEGFACILMALPLACPLGALGALLAFYAQRSPQALRGATLMLLLPPATLVFDTHAPQPTFAVRTQIEIAATPAQVWPHVISFSSLPEPHEWYFRAGVAYPQRARIEGTGPGATRYCDFSTGPFVEPIEVWDAPRLLRFRVTHNPAPLNEWSPYGHLDTRHLHGYLVSRGGQFQLTPLPNGHTLLTGTTWYQHNLFPAQYWRWWSDAIIHRIHLRVLTHIRTLAEQNANTH